MKDEQLNERQKKILNIIQEDFPIEEEPFEMIDKKLEFPSGTTLKEMKLLKNKGLIRQISPIYDTRKLGYKSTLVAFDIPQENLIEGVKIINSHPGVSHNYERTDSYNVWFTIAVPPEISLEKTIEILARESKAKRYMILPTLRLFKIGVKLDVAGTEGMYEESSSNTIRKEDSEFKPLPQDVMFIKITQKSIPIENKPFKFYTEKLNISFEEMKKKFSQFQEKGIMRRFAAILRHRKSGFSVNAMVVWKLPDGCDPQIIGEMLGSFRAVSHCYLRPSFPDFPYSLYSMIHTKTYEECNKIVEEMKTKTGLSEYKILISSREFKKVRIVYFSDAFDRWNKKYGLGPTSS
jgi:siroheme decarboxylase